MLLDRSRLALNPDARAVTVQIGPEPELSALVVDDLFVDPDYVRALALSLDYRVGRGTFPGYEARVSLAPDALLARARRWIDPRLRMWPGFGDCLVFSMMHEGSDPKLRHYPHPHLDQQGVTADAACIGSLVYLNPPDQCRGGTAFYRHRQTGLIGKRGELTPGLAAYMVEHQLASVDEAFAHIELADIPDDPPGEWGYITESNGTWERLAVIEMKYNRFVAFDGMFYHHPHLRSGDFGRTDDTRRLTLTAFFELPW